MAGGYNIAIPVAAPVTAPSRSGGGFGILDGLSSGSLKLAAPVGPGAANNPNDVFRVESVLSAGDFLSRPPGRTFGDDTFGAIKTAQARLNDDPRVDVGRSPLKLDGLVNLDGPTQATTRRLAGAVGVAGRRDPGTDGAPDRLEEAVNGAGP